MQIEVLSLFFAVVETAVKRNPTKNVLLVTAS